MARCRSLLSSLFEASSTRSSDPSDSSDSDLRFPEAAAVLRSSSFFEDSTTLYVGIGAGALVALLILLIVCRICCTRADKRKHEVTSSNVSRQSRGGGDNNVISLESELGDDTGRALHSL